MFRTAKEWYLIIFWGKKTWDMGKKRDNVRNSDMSNRLCSVSDELLQRAVPAAEMNKSHQS